MTVFRDKDTSRGQLANRIGPQQPLLASHLRLPPREKVNVFLHITYSRTRLFAPFRVITSLIIIH